jgi:hypothetical protein
MVNIVLFKGSFWELSKNLFFNLKISIFEANFGNIIVGVFVNIIYANFETVFNSLGFFLNFLFIYFIYSFYKDIYDKINSNRIITEYENMCDSLSIYVEDIKCNLHAFDKFDYPRPDFKPFPVEE